MLDRAMVFGLAASVATLLFVLELVRRRRLREEYSLLWLVTALALNRNIVGRGFFRSVFFYPVLLSPVVVALIWKWILQQDGLLKLAGITL